MILADSHMTWPDVAAIAIPNIVIAAMVIAYIYWSRKT